MVEAEVIEKVVDEVKDSVEQMQVQDSNEPIESIEQSEVE